jgi:DNA polymerase
LDWEALKTKASTCEACRLSATRHHVAFGCSVEANSGKNKAPAPATVTGSLDWLILDYMPSDLEDQTKNPLLSESGQLLANMLKALRGLHKNWGVQMGNSSPAPEPSMVLVNALKCHSPASTSVQAAEVLQCSAYLRRQIELLKPKAILVLGLHAYKALFINQSQDVSSSTSAQLPFAQLRSQIHEIQQTPTFLTYHPSYLLTHPQDKAKAWQDLCLAHEHFQRSSG